ncbi:hypothetical protein PV04_04079 [Phialophora macrospora]|uniref:Zn(2)-C6 fungal-type domain-containing protein n=1 Tax=Phialophora macrospora TaxID=1851006 RepID=A0A0D2E1A9_9EURO|nr:hypothetical protein PV04_04079 [Phialophora macrospora]
MAFHRQAHSKVRTGCRTCKSRRVKCDETRPACLRCMKAKYICEGYSISLTGVEGSASETRTQPHQDQPQHWSQLQHSHVVHHHHHPRPRDIRPADSSCFYRTLQTLADLSEPDSQAYDFCRRHTVHDMGTHHLARFWTRTVMAASHGEPAVLHALLALSGAHRHYMARLGGSASASTGAAATGLAMPAYAHYGKALRHLRDRIPGPSTGESESGRAGEVQVVLMVCLILLTFDIIEGRYNEALVHLNHGREILMGVGKTTRDSIVAAATLPAGGDDASAAVHLYLPEKVHSTMDELSYSFALMDLQSIHFGSTRLQFKLVDTPRNSDHTQSSVMPEQFGTFDDAWRSMLLLLNETYRFAAAARALPNPGDSEEFVIWQGRLLARLKQWKEIFDDSPLRKAPSQGASGATASEYDPSAALRLNHSYLTVMVGIALSFGDEMASDRFLPQFSAMVSLCEDLIIRLPTISLDASLIPALYTTACVCRHPGVRRRALQVVSRAGREGHWDGRQIAIVAGQKMMLEEEMAGFSYEAMSPPPEKPELLAEIIPRTARWSEMCADFVGDDYAVLQLVFRRKRVVKGQSGPGLAPLPEGHDNEYETRKKLVRLGQTRLSDDS